MWVGPPKTAVSSASLEGTSPFSPRGISRIPKHTRKNFPPPPRNTGLKLHSPSSGIYFMLKWINYLSGNSLSLGGHLSKSQKPHVAEQTMRMRTGQASRISGQGPYHLLPSPGLVGSKVRWSCVWHHRYDPHPEPSKFLESVKGQAVGNGPRCGDLTCSRRVFPNPALGKSLTTI